MSQVLNPSELLARFGGKKELLARLARIFQEQTPRLLQEIRGAIQRADAPATEHAAHTLKGSLAQLGAIRASELAREVETAARSGVLSGLEVPLKHLEQQADSIQRTLNELTQST